MKEIRLKARAKINLTLDVTGKREDGYHFLETIMQTLSLYDGIYMKPVQKSDIVLKSNIPWLPLDSRNLAYKAALMMQEEFSISQGIFIEINKRIPVAAGLAGGSADCAAVLVGMNRLFDLGLSQKELESFAYRLGSDIPYCVRRGTVLAKGIGEDLATIPCGCPPCYVVLAKLPVSVSTPSVYKALRWQEIENHPDTDGMIQAMARKDIGTMGMKLGNVLETVTIPIYPKIAQMKRALLDFGAAGALMSGSGPTVFGIFEDEEKARQAAAAIRKMFALRDVVFTTIYQPRGQDVRGEEV